RRLDRRVGRLDYLARGAARRGHRSGSQRSGNGRDWRGRPPAGRARIGDIARGVGRALTGIHSMAAHDNRETFGRTRLSFAEEADIDEFVTVLDRFERG